MTTRGSRGPAPRAAVAPSGSVTLRATVVVVALATLAALLTCVAVSICRPAEGATLSDLLASWAEAALALVAGGWAALTAYDVATLARATAAGQGRRPHGRRLRAAAILLGTAVGGSAMPATAAPRPPVAAAGTLAPRAEPSTGPVSPDLSPTGQVGPAPVSPELPHQPAGPVRPDPSPLTPGPRPRSAPSTTTTVVVHRGDTLWSIARRHLPAGVDDADVAHAVRAWHRSNRDVVGPDADLIRPGQVLRAPAASTAPTGAADHT